VPYRLSHLLVPGDRPQLERFLRLEALEMGTLLTLTTELRVGAANQAAKALDQASARALVTCVDIRIATPQNRSLSIRRWQALVFGSGQAARATGC
jgi:hypothetical protein